MTFLCLPLAQIPVYAGGGGVQPQLPHLEPRIPVRINGTTDPYPHR